jgi:hypothetical protein
MCVLYGASLSTAVDVIDVALNDIAVVDARPPRTVNVNASSFSGVGST